MEKDYNDLFDGDDTSNTGDFMNDNAVETSSFSKGIIHDDEDDDIMLASGHPRQRSHFLEDDENSVGMTFGCDYPCC